MYKARNHVIFSGFTICIYNIPLIDCTFLRHINMKKAAWSSGERIRLVI